MPDPQNGPATVRPRPRWVTPPIDAAQAEALAAALGTAALAARVLCARGFGDAADARRFLDPSLDDLHDPARLLDLPAAVARLCRAVAACEKILIYGDYDVDGTTSVVILKKAIELAGGSASFHVPDRFREGYGMRPEIVERAAAEGVSLIISVDTGIRAGEVVRRAAELGIDVIITDHHLPEAELPPAFAVLNPNRPDCRYPDKNLCGVGVAFKLVQALLATLGWAPDKLRRTLLSFLKLVAIGTVADVVPLIGENRILVKHGLGGLGMVRNPGLRALLNVAGFAEGNSPSAGQVAFRVAPRINAAGRMATATQVIELFLTDDRVRAADLAQQLHVLNGERQQAEREIVETILRECDSTPGMGSDAALVFAGAGWHRGVLGIVAARLVERFYRPTFVLSLSEEDGTAQGSGRSIAAFHLLGALELMHDLFVKFGGHKHAAGITLEAGRVDEFRSRLNAYATSTLTPQDLQPALLTDTVVDLRELTGDTVAAVLSLEPFGLGNPAPLLVARGVEVTSQPSVIKDKHLRVNVRQRGAALTLKAWNFGDRRAELQPGARLDIAFAVEKDAYSLARGYEGWAAVLRDVKPS